MAEPEEYREQEQTLAAASEEENQTNGVVNDSETTKGSLPLKLKIPKVADHHHQFMEDEYLQLQQQRQKRACLQKIKNNNTTQKPKIKNVVTVKSEESNNHICYVCHQNFRSLKSLYGHMRKHPEREWRGILPPKHHHSASMGPMGSGEGLVESLKGWSAKRKRGQMSSSSDEDEEEEGMQQAVNDLLLLAQLSASDNVAAMSSKNNVSSGVLKIKEKRRKIDDNEEEDQDDDDDDGENKKKVNIEMKDGGLGFDDCNSEDTSIYHEDDSDDMKRLNQQNKNKKRRLNDAVDVGAVKDEPMVSIMAANNQTYSCSICNKAFDMHQALGGHVASHNKSKNVKESSDEETSGESLRVQDAAAAVAAGCSCEHKCNICNKTFPTGQALGGHKRCHWTGPAEAFSNSSQVTTSAGEVTHQRSPSSPSVLVHDFDLNDTPPEYYQFHGVEVAVAAATVS